MSDFYNDLPVFDDFEKVLDPSIYQPLPDDWWVGATDIVGSTKAIENGRFKDVNIVGASVICAISNILNHSDYPFIFGGDGASFACPPDHIDRIRDAMAATAVWARETLDFDLRVALVPISAIRTAGKDIKVARYGPSDAVSYAMFTGGGMQWVDDQMKQGHYLVPPAPDGSRPDLTGLSCRWSPIQATGSDVILSIIVNPTDNEDAFKRTIMGLFDLLDLGPDKSSPIPKNGPDFSFPPTGLDLEAQATKHVEGGYIRAWLKALFVAFIAWVLLKTGGKMGDFDSKRYRDYTGRNTDFRKFGDALRMTVNCSLERTNDIEAFLQAAEDRGDVVYGTHRQDSAIMTCIVPSITNDGHYHFLDGGNGGYTSAASVFKAKMKATH
ncbi:DUF3095 domain-containing protein [Thalassospira sp. MA62]|nr:DUF3095 domain-containing protein [Thalassospira sp. MA62]